MFWNSHGNLSTRDNHHHCCAVCGLHHCCTMNTLPSTLDIPYLTPLDIADKKK